MESRIEKINRRASKLKDQYRLCQLLNLIDLKLSNTALQLYIELSDMDLICTKPNISALAQVIGVSETTIQNGLKELKKDGLKTYKDLINSEPII